jgi:Tfp pilus assembly protein PilZ
MRHRDDQDHLNHATAQGRVLYSFNIGDYNRIHSEYISQNKSHAGIILAQQQRYGVGEQMRRLLRIISVKIAEQMQNNVEFLSSWK